MLRISRNFLTFCAVGAVVVLASSPAQATSYGYCSFRWGPATDQKVYESGIVEIEDGQEARDLFKEGPFRTGFLDYIHSTVPGTEMFGISYVSCDVWPSMDDAKNWQTSAVENEYTHPVLTGWLGGRPPAVDRKEVKPRYREGDVILAAPGQKVEDAQEPGNSAAAQEQRKWDEEAYQRKVADWQAAMERNRQANAEYERQKAETERKRAEMAEKARQERADWERRVAACKAGDYSQCAPLATPQ
jgi:hypothetical protein